MSKLQKSMELQVERETDSAIKEREQLTPQNAQKKKQIFKQKQKKQTVTAIKQHKHTHTHVHLDIGTLTHNGCANTYVRAHIQRA